jgi:hypothetical protein
MQPTRAEYTYLLPNGNPSSHVAQTVSGFPTHHPSMLANSVLLQRPANPNQSKLDFCGYFQIEKKVVTMVLLFYMFA